MFPIEPIQKKIAVNQDILNSILSELNSFINVFIEHLAKSNKKILIRIAITGMVGALVMWMGCIISFSNRDNLKIHNNYAIPIILIIFTAISTVLGMAAFVYGLFNHHNDDIKITYNKLLFNNPSISRKNEFLNPLNVFVLLLANIALYYKDTHPAEAKKLCDIALILNAPTDKRIRQIVSLLEEVKVILALLSTNNAPALSLRFDKVGFYDDYKNKNLNKLGYGLSDLSVFAAPKQEAIVQIDDENAVELVEMGNGLRNG